MKNNYTVFDTMVLFTVFLFKPAYTQAFINYRTATTSTVLSNNHITAMAMDAQGNNRFATQDGISKFDGTSWTHYMTEDGLISSFINTVAIDNEGNKWIAINRDVSKLYESATDIKPIHKNISVNQSSSGCIASQFTGKNRNT